MDDMTRFEIIYNHLTDTENKDQLIENLIKYVQENNHTKINYTARDIFENVISEETLQEMFDEN